MTGQRNLPCFDGGGHCWGSFAVDNYASMGNHCMNCSSALSYWAWLLGIGLENAKRKKFQLKEDSYNLFFFFSCLISFLILAYIFYFFLGALDKRLCLLQICSNCVFYFPFISLYFLSYYILVKEYEWYIFYIIELIRLIFMFLHVIKFHNDSTGRHLKIIYIVYRVENLYILEIQ